MSRPDARRGIYNTCDQWCMYCPATARCLVFRCSPEIESGKYDIHSRLADRMYEGIEFVTRRDFPFEIAWSASGPAPMDVFAWFHTLIAVKVYRALAGSALVARGTDSRKQDVLCSAKVALIGIDRSFDALGAIASDDVDARLELLQGHFAPLEARGLGALSGCARVRARRVGLRVARYSTLA